MKIVYNIYSVFNSGGMERVLANKANYLADVLNHDVYIITTDQQGKPCFFTFSKKIHFIDLNINYSRVSNLNVVIKIVYRAYCKFRHFFALKKCLKNIHPDICISMCCGELDFLYLLHRKSAKIIEYHFSKNAKLIATTNKFIKVLQYFRIKLYTLIMSWYDCSVYLTEEDRENWGKSDKNVTIPNSLVNFPAKYSDLNNKVVVAVGRLEYQKGFDLLLKAWAVTIKKCPKWKLYIYGSGNEYDHLCSIVQSYNLNQSVCLFPPTNDIASAYQNASIYVMSSRYEGLPMALLEAMSYGLPLVSFDCPCGPKDLIKDNGILAEKGNAEQLANALIKLMSTPSLRKEMGSKSIKYSMDYSHESIMNQWNDLFVKMKK